MDVRAPTKLTFTSCATVTLIKCRRAGKNESPGSDFGLSSNGPRIMGDEGHGSGSFEGKAEKPQFTSSLATPRCYQKPTSTHLAAGSHSAAAERCSGHVKTPVVGSDCRTSRSMPGDRIDAVVRTRAVADCNTVSSDSGGGALARLRVARGASPLTRSLSVARRVHISPGA